LDIILLIEIGLRKQIILLSLRETWWWLWGCVN